MLGDVISLSFYCHGIVEYLGLSTAARDAVVGRIDEVIAARGMARSIPS